MDSIALTDHGVMYGAIEYYKEALKAGVKPIIGMEAYTCNIPQSERNEQAKKEKYHLVLLAKDDEGYKNLMKLTSIAHIEGYYYRPRFDKETLKKYSKGLIATSACPLGEIGQNLINDDYKKAKKTAEWFLDVFGDDYYLEVQRHSPQNLISDAPSAEIKRLLQDLSESEKKYLEGTVKLSRELGIPLVATNDAHYIKKEDAQAQDALVCIATGKTVADFKRLRYIDNPDFFLKSGDEMAKVFHDLPDALENTLKVSKKCNLEITLDKWFFPKYILEDARTAEEELTERARQGAKDIFGKDLNEEIKKRLQYELDTINQKGYATYFLIVSDMARWATANGIVTNTRGSAAGSLVSYCTGIININPLTYDLPFERFLTPWRPSPPDIDFDIADDRREEVINYMVDKYGSNKVAQICTFGRMLSRAAVRDVARVLGYPYSTGDRIAKLIPPPKQGFPITIPKALEEVKELKDLYDSDPDTKKVLDLAIQIEGNARHVSVHAAGVVIAPGDINEYTPLQLDPEGKKKITQYDMDALDPNVSPGGAVGLLKFDLLGLRNLSILGAALEIIRKENKADIDVLSIPLTDKKTFEMLSKGSTMGVFQLGASSGMSKYLKDLKPTRVEDLMAMVALYRPGPISSIPEYIDRKNNPAKVKYFDERMKEYLSKSYGLLVYQDDVLSTVIKLAGYSWEDADKFRKAIGKKIPAEMEKQHEKFVKGCVEGGMKEEKAQALFGQIETFAAYGFNKAHAASYGMLAYRTAYLKANYPVEYMTALLTAESQDTDKISAAINECRRLKIPVLPPDINKSEVDFTIDDESIRFGLSAIKNVGVAAIGAILEARKKSPFASFSDFLARVDSRKVNKKVLESLIKVGALSSFGNRATLLKFLDDVRNRVSKPKGDKNQQALFTVSTSTTTVALPQVDEFNEEELQNLERQLLGFSLSAKPISELLGGFEHEATHKIFEISPIETYGENVRLAAVVSEVRIIVTRNSGAEMAFVRVDDGTGSIELVVFPKIFRETRDFWVEGKPILAYGRVDARGETPSLILESLQTPKTPQAEVFLTIPEGTSREKLSQLKGLLLANPGSKTAYLVFGERRIKLPFGVTWGETLAKRIEDVLK